MNFLQKHLQQTSHTELSPEEKSAMRHVLMRSIEYTTPVASPYVPFFGHWSQLVRVTSGALVVVLLVGTTTYAAQGALPGDLLYPVKINVNEQVQTALATSDEAKAQLNVNLAVERVQEAEQLAVSGRLSTTTAAEIQTNFDTHAQEATIYTKKIHKTNVASAKKLSEDFSASLNVHSNALAVLSDLPDASATTTASTIGEKSSKNLSDHIRARAEKLKQEIQNEDSGSGSTGDTPESSGALPQVDIHTPEGN